MLEVIYLIFNEGYAATAGDDLIRPALCAEAQRLGRILAGVAPDEPEVFGLLALMEIQASRLAARTAPDGAPVPLTEQNRARWDQLLIRRGLAALQRAEALGGADGPYALQAAIAACHARARRVDGDGLAADRGALRHARAVMPSPVVELNRAVAHSMAFGPEAGLKLVDEIAQAAVLRNYAPLPAAKGDFLFRAGRLAEAKVQFERAAGFSRNAREKAFLLARGGLRRLTHTGFTAVTRGLDPRVHPFRNSSYVCRNIFTDEMDARVKPAHDSLMRGAAAGRFLSGVHQDLGPVLEMHGVVMVPLAAPHEAVRFEHAHDLPWDLVLVADAAARIGLRP